MTQSDRRPAPWTALAATAIAAASAITIAVPPALADPVPPPAPTTAAPAPAEPAAPADPNAAPAPASPAPAPAPADPNAAPAPASPAPAPAPADPNAAPAPAPAPADPNAAPAPASPAPAPADPNAAPAPAAGPPAPAAPETSRVENAAGGFSYLLPAGWEVADASRLSYGQALLLKQAGPAPLPGQPAATANDTSVLLGRLDLKLFAGAEADNNKAAVRLASDMGEFFMPFPGTRINQQTTTLQAADMPGAASSYEVKFTDTAKPNGQIWAGVVGSGSNRWFVVWLGTAKSPIDPAAAKALAQSIRPYTPPPAPVAPAADPNAPAAPAAPGDRVGVPVPVTTPVPGMEIPGLPAPAPAPEPAAAPAAPAAPAPAAPAAPPAAPAPAAPPAA